MTVRDRETVELRAVRDDVEDGAVRLAKVVHAQVELLASAQRLEHVGRVQMGDVGRVESAVLEVQVLQRLVESAQKREEPRAQKVERKVDFLELVRASEGLVDAGAHLVDFLVRIAAK